jgi:ParB-like chromosome segregation protein Spo0J
MRILEIDPRNVLVVDRARTLREDAVAPLIESMRRVGLRTPITVRIEDERADADGVITADVPVLVAGRHRLEAAIRLGWQTIQAVEIVDAVDARLWEISENLHRAELSAVERAEHIDEWRRLTVEKVRQNAAPLPGGAQPADKGHRKTAAALGVPEKTVRRAERIASLPDDVKDQARAEDWSQSRLLAAARPTPKAPPIAPYPLEEEQAIEAQVKRLMAAWNAAGPDARSDFLVRIKA